MDDERSPTTVDKTIASKYRFCRVWLNFEFSTNESMPNNIVEKWLFVD
jgi:hypothetical protein